MPARRRGQEANRAERRQQRTASRPSTRVLDEVEQGWAEHQKYERLRRAPEPLDAEIRRVRQREAMWQSILRAKAVVEADFARWRADSRG